MNSAFAINCQHVTKKFGNLVAVNRVSLQIPHGGIFGLIGPNGAGKTTLFSLILGFLDSQEGSIEVLGVPPTLLYRLPRKIGVFAQDAELPYSTTVHQILKFFARILGIEKSAVDAEISRVLHLVQMEKWQNVKLSHLSHGMRKRIYIAQTLLGQPPLVILDEPTAGLDPEHAFQVTQILDQMRHQTTIVLSSHNLDELENLCDRAAIIVKGEIVASGAMSEIRKTKEEIHIIIQQTHCDIAPLQQALAHTHVSFNQEERIITIKFTAATSQTADEISQIALKTLLNNGLIVQKIERGKSLLSTYLELSSSHN